MGQRETVNSRANVISLNGWQELRGFFYLFIYSKIHPLQGHGPLNIDGYVRRQFLRIGGKDNCKPNHEQIKIVVIYKTT